MITFFNSFFNYIVLMVLFVAAGFAGALLGKFARKKKDNSVASKNAGAEE